MAGATKRRIRKAREEGNHDLADWLVARSDAKDKGEPLYRWDKENPKPGAVVTPDKIRVMGKVNEINYYKDSAKLDDVQMPRHEREILARIEGNKENLKKRAVELALTDQAGELRLLYKVIKRLDIEARRIIYRYDFAKFDRDFFSDLQDRVETAPFHFEMVRLYNSSKRACVVCPRGHAKSTTARKYILHNILYKETKYAVIVGASEDMAAQNLRWVRDQLTDNDLLIEVFGWLKNKDKWADTEFQTNGGIKVVAKGAGQKIRGANERGRPDFIYIDDLEEDEQVASRDRRQKLRRWFAQALMPSRSKNGRVIITGTILHLDSLLKNISENKVKDHLSWQVLWYEAISKDGEGNEKALWPEFKPLEELIALRETDPETFSQEYQNNPASGSMAVFNRGEYQYLDSSQIVNDPSRPNIYVDNKPVNILITTDLALSAKEGADYTVFMVTGMDENSNLYVLHYERFRSSDPYEQIDMLFYLMATWRAEVMTMEVVAFQQTFKRMLEYEQEKRETFFYVHEIARQNVRKIFRIKSLKAPIKAHKIAWLHEHFELEEELSQVTATSLGTHDDVIDCLADAWEVQVELAEDRPGPSAPINSVAWAIEEGLFPTESEREEFSLYG